jgi:hypothetical protein
VDSLLSSTVCVACSVGAGDAPDKRCRKFPGYEFVLHRDSVGGDLPEISQPFDRQLDPELLATRCNKSNDCEAFNTLGYAKYKVAPKEELQSEFRTNDPCAGIYLRLPSGGCTQQALLTQSQQSMPVT